VSLTAVELRHLLHQNPELSFEEYATTRAIAENLSEFSARIKVHAPLETGLVVEYHVNSGPYLLFRADIDALPLEEKTGCQFSSNNAFMHACGHDVHTAALYGFLKYAVGAHVDKNILFLFQPGEETGGGAQRIMDTGILKRFNISAAFSTHVTDEYPAGSIASNPGVLFASAREVDIEFFGESSHIAFPEKGINAFNGLRMFLDMIDAVPQNEAIPFIFGIGKISAGCVRNIVPASARLEGSIRTLSSKLSDDFYETLGRILDSIKTRTAINYSIKTGSFYPEVKVDEALYSQIKKAASDKFNFIVSGYKMTGEDFGFISREYPSFMFWLGTGGGQTSAGLHNPMFLPGDESVQNGIEAFKMILNSF